MRYCLCSNFLMRVGLLAPKRPTEMWNFGQSLFFLRNYKSIQVLPMGISGRTVLTNLAQEIQMFPFSKWAPFKMQWTMVYCPNLMNSRILVAVTTVTLVKGIGKALIFKDQLTPNLSKLKNSSINLIISLLSRETVWPRYLGILAAPSFQYTRDAGLSSWYYSHKCVDALNYKWASF